MAVVSLDTAVNVALPAMSADLAAPIAELQWIIIAYVLTTTSLVLGCGRAADLFGRQRVWTAGFFLLALALAACSAARSVELLAVARVAQAVGAAMATATGAALVTAAFPAHQRGRALGLMAMGASAGLALGPVVGGPLVTGVGWPAVFLARSPLALAIGILSLLVLRQDHHSRQRVAFDMAGAFLVAASMVLFVLGLNRGPVWGWGTARVLGLFALALGGLYSFVIRERSARPPLIDLNLFQHRPFAIAAVTGFLSNLAMFGVWLLLPYALIDGRGMAATQAGWLLACVPLATALAAPVSGRLSDRIGTGKLVCIGMLIEALALAVLAQTAGNSGLPVVVTGLLTLGIGLGIFQAPNQSVVMGSVPPAALGVAGGVLALVRGLGIVTGVAILGTVYAALQPGDAYSAAAFRGAFLTAAGIAAGGSVLALAVWRR